MRPARSNLAWRPLRPRRVVGGATADRAAIVRVGLRGIVAAAAAAVWLAGLGGCEVDSFLNPSVSGYWQHTPTTIPILERIDVIERDEDYWGQTSSVTSDDLIPSDLTYRAAPGDYVTVQIYELFNAGEWSNVTRRVDPAGLLRVPKLGEIEAAGLTAQQITDALEKILERDFMTRPQVDVVVEEGSAFHYTVYGDVRAPGLYNLIDPNLRLLDALATAGGVPSTTETIYVIRRVPLSESVKPSFDRTRPGEGPVPPAQQQQPPPTETAPPVDIEDLINELGEQPAPGPAKPPAPPPSAPSPPSTPPGAAPPASEQPPVDIDELMKQIEREQGEPEASPGMLGQETPPPASPPKAGDRPVVDIQDLEPVQVPGEPEVDIDELRRREAEQRDQGSWIYVEERGEWVRVPGGAQQPAAAGPAASEGEPPLFAERIVEISNTRLMRGDSRYNIVIRPNDLVFVQPQPEGVVYIDGQVNRPGTFTLPPAGITLSRLVASAGGLGQIAIPERVDLIRMVEDSREAAIRINLAAIRKRTEPDIKLKPNDHIIVGTNFWAQPLAVLRNGFRVTYGFGFILDRNFGTDVFGAPPGSFTN